MTRIRIHTDGACTGNPGPGGWAAVINYPKELKEISGFEKQSTNNRMELKAALEAINEVLKSKVSFKRLEIYSDSAYLVNAINQKWVKKWSFNGWRTINGVEVKNKDLWEELFPLLKNRKISFIKVKGHNGDKWNERADFLAKKQIYVNL